VFVEQTLINLIRAEYKIALVTTASRKNTIDIITTFGVNNLFDLIITQEDVIQTKPNPECFLKAMKIMEITADNTLIFEDSKEGLMAAELSGAKYMQVYGYN
jgi:beta-phosphoglucomutase